jgi:hypothetical protein
MEPGRGCWLAAPHASHSRLWGRGAVCSCSVRVALRLCGCRTQVLQYGVFRYPPGPAKGDGETEGRPKLMQGGVVESSRRRSHSRRATRCRCRSMRARPRPMSSGPSPAPSIGLRSTKGQARKTFCGRAGLNAVAGGARPATSTSRLAFQREGLMEADL